MKKIVSRLTAALTSAVILASCGTTTVTTGGQASPDNTTGGSTTPLKIEVIAKGFTQQFWTAVKNGSQQAADEYNVEMNFTGPANETAIQEQANMLANAINKDPDAIALASLDTVSQVDLLNQAKQKGIPIIGFDSGVPDAPEGSVLATAATDNKAAAKIAGEKIFEAVQSKIAAASAENPVRVAVLSQEVNSQSISERTEGFIESITEKSKALANVGDAIAVVGNDKYNTGDASKAVVIIQVQVPADATDSNVQSSALALLNMENLVGVFSSNETASKGLLNANESLGGVLGSAEDKIVAAGFDSGTLQKEAVKNGTFIGSVTQDPITIGYSAVELAVKVARGEAVSDFAVPAAWYNAENIDSAEIAPLLYD